jgi:hypothetical protein
VYQDVLLHGLSSTTRYSESEEENLIQHAVRYLEERFLHQGNIEKSITVFGTFAWPTGSTLEDPSISEVLTLAEHFNQQLSTPNMNDECKQVLCNEWYEF